jgi:hypothetical protein
MASFLATWILSDLSLFGLGRTYASGSFFSSCSMTGRLGITVGTP